MKIKQIIKEYETPALDAVDATDTYAPPSKGFAIRVDGPFGSVHQGQPQGVPAATLWYGLTAVFPRDYPPAAFQSVGQQMASPQARILNTIRREGSAVVKSGIASRDLAETLANKLASYGPPPPPDETAGPIPMSHIQVVSQDLDEDVKVPGPMRMNDYHDQADAIQEKLRQAIQTGNKQLIQQLSKQRDDLDAHVKTHGMMPEAARPPIAPDPQNYDSDWDYYNDRDADDMTDSDPADDMTDDEPDDWFDESREKVGNMDADAFDAALSRMKKLAGAGPLRTVYDPNKRVYKNVPHAVQPAQQPKKAK